MTDWRSTSEIMKDGEAFDRLVHVLLGLYIWEWVISMDFDWAYITRKKIFRWPMIFYFLNRYCLLFSLIGIVVALNVTTEINCQNLYTFNQCLGNAAIGLASINLSLRTMAVWSREWFIVMPLVAIIMGHWSLLLHGVLLKAEWIENQYVITNTDNKLLAVTFIYSMCFDLLVLLLTAFKVLYPATGRSRLASLIFKDGLIFFLLAFLANLIATIFMLLNLNVPMSIISNVPAAIVSSIIACRIVRRLSNFSNSGTETFPVTIGTSTIAFRFDMSADHSSKVSTANTDPGVHVQMETFEGPIDENVYDDYDVSGKPTGTTLDSEAQVTSRDFKNPVTGALV